MIDSVAQNSSKSDVSDRSSWCKWSMITDPASKNTKSRNNQINKTEKNNNKKNYLPTKDVK